VTVKTAQQLKALVRNLSKGNSIKAQEIMRSYATERFLERVSLSRYYESIVLKGGVLIAAMVGIDSRFTMDIDTTIRNLTLSEESAAAIVDDIISIPLDDGISFLVKEVRTIMDDADYPGIRVLLEAELERIRIPLKIDISANDVITPATEPFAIKLMFEDRSFTVTAYNLETVLAEKMQTVVARSVANTRMRDFYDLYILERTCDINPETLREAFDKTSSKRNTKTDRSAIAEILQTIETNQRMIKLWSSYRSKYEYANHVEWEDAMSALSRIFSHL